MKKQIKTVVLGVTGSIAAYKSAQLVSSLRKKGIEVKVIMTASACEFITPMTLEILSNNRVICNMFDRNHQWEVQHISLAKWADVFAIVPASANFISKMASGIADDMLTTTVMATKAKILVAPAMNTAMYENLILSENIEKLKSVGVSFIEPCDGLLACGDVGKGKLCDISYIEDAILNAYMDRDLSGINILVTAGPTCEPIDPVRFITNRSTGKMGYSIARRALERGARVTLITGSVDLPVPKNENIHVIEVNTSVDMHREVFSNLLDQDIIIKAAAVSDYRPVVYSNHKIKKKDDVLSISLVKNPDILKEIGAVKRDNQVLCGFSMETRDLMENSQIKLRDKNCDMIVANDLSVEGAGFATDTNVVTLISRDGRTEEISRMSKMEIAEKILDRLLNVYNGIKKGEVRQYGL